MLKNNSFISKEISSSSIFPASILDKSSTLFIRLNNMLASENIFSTNIFASKGRSISLKISQIPIIPFKGVLISWDMFAINMVFASLAFSARSLASIISLSICFLFVISLTIPLNPIGFPSLSLIRLTEFSIYFLFPPLETISHSRAFMGSPVLYT